LVEQLVDFC